MNEQNATPDNIPGSSVPVANFQAYGNAGVMDDEGSSTSSEEPLKNFMSALQTMEKDRDVTRMAAQFRDSCKLWRQSSSHSYEGFRGMQDFWNEYLKQFQTIETNFTNVMERDDLAVLEWESRGSLQGGHPIHYRGVSILEFGDDGKVESFKTYFDSARFINLQLTPGGVQPS